MNHTTVLKQSFPKLSKITPEEINTTTNFHRNGSTNKPVIAVDYGPSFRPLLPTQRPGSPNLGNRAPENERERDETNDTRTSLWTSISLPIIQTRPLLLLLLSGDLVSSPQEGK